MGRMLGAFDNDEELDRPDLNKCPDCRCFFADDVCPLCGAVCPEEMRAGNRKPVRKSRRKHGGPQYRHASLDWYHRWWFIILMMFVSPMSIVGIVLLLTSPRRVSTKVIALVILAAYLVLSTFGISGIVQGISNLFGEPVDRSLSESEYITVCEQVSPSDYYRAPRDYKGAYVAMNLTVGQRVVDAEASSRGGEYVTYYVCYDESARFSILVRDCRANMTPALMSGDMITVYGEGADSASFYDAGLTVHDGPVVNAAFIAVIG